MGAAAFLILCMVLGRLFQCRVSIRTHKGACWLLPSRVSGALQDDPRVRETFFTPAIQASAHCRHAKWIEDALSHICSYKAFHWSMHGKPKHLLGVMVNYCTCTLHGTLLSVEKFTPNSVCLFGGLVCIWIVECRRSNVY